MGDARSRLRNLNRLRSVSRAYKTAVASSELAALRRGLAECADEMDGLSAMERRVWFRLSGTRAADIEWTT